jgi:SpoVK/Ycf46/Vps4 family AAA+-type ATPase
MYYAHKQTKFIYKVVREYRNADGSPMVQLVRVSDGAGPIPMSVEALNQYYEGASTETQEAKEESTLGVLTEPKYSMDDLVLPEEVREELLLGLAQASNAKKIAEAFGKSRFQKTTLNFHGAPGTGKTMSAHAVADALGKPLYIADYASLRSKWHGETAKNLKQMFAEAKELGAVLFLDEADTLLSSRVEGGGSEIGEALNHEKNVFMQELDRFDGVILMATNLFGNYDQALNRRIARHISFPMPDPSARARILEKLLGTRHTVDLVDASLMSEDMGGGDLDKAVENAQVRAFSRNPENPIVTHEDLIVEIERVRRGKIDQGLVQKRRKIGL